MKKLSPPVRIFIWFLLAHAVGLLMITVTFPKINAVLGTQAFDLSPMGYSVETARAMLAKLDPATTKLYLYLQIMVLDVLYPALLALFLGTWMKWLYHINGFNTASIWSKIYLFPITHMIIDYLENLCVAIMISTGPQVSSTIIQASSIFTVTKGLFTTTSWIIILPMLAFWLKRKFSKE